MLSPIPLAPPEIGAIFLPPDRCQFRVWAPKPQRVALRLVGPPERVIPMTPEPDGYWVATADRVSPGTRYLFDLGHVRRPDPASRWQPDGVHGPSAVVEPRFGWTDAGWVNPDLADYILYELHIGTFTPEGTFDAAIRELDRLQELGITAVEVMPIAQFPGSRNWGYDGVYPFAVQHSYGGPVGFKRFVNACHSRGIAVVLDVVYNHLGPEGNYLREFGPYFTTQYRTPWGDALNFDGPGSDHVRGYFLANACDWQTEFHIDALRLDAANAIKDFSAYPFLTELGEVTRSRGNGRKFHLIAESDANDSRFVQPVTAGGLGLDAQWADDLHHALHALLTGDRCGFYAGFGGLGQLDRAYRDGYAYSGQYHPYRGRRHGNSPAGLHPWQFVVCSQNHDQIGNRPLGDRLHKTIGFEGHKLAAGLILSSPFVPLLFMGEEYGESAPFQYFVSHGDPQLVEAVRAGRRRESAEFGWKGDPPDPQDEATYRRSKLDMTKVREGRAAILHRFYQTLIRLRKEIPALGCRGDFPPDVMADEKHTTLTVCRTAPGSEVVMVYHLGNDRTDLRVSCPSGWWRPLFDSSATEWDGPGAAVSGPVESDGELALTVAPRSFVVLLREG